MMLRHLQHSPTWSNSRSDAALAAWSSKSSRPGSLSEPACQSHQNSSGAAWCNHAVHRQNSSSATSSRAAGVICRDRPMWARGPAPDSGGGGPLDRMITKNISNSGSLIELENVCNEWGGSFNYIHTAAALVKFAKLSRRGADSKLLSFLQRKWVQLLPEAGPRACGNVLWACSGLSKQQVVKVWDPTWAAFVKHAEQQLQGRPVDQVPAQNIANVVYAAAKLRRQPPGSELQLLVQAFLQPAVLAAAQSQHVANFLWALSKLYQLPGWQVVFREQDLQQLLGEQQLQLLETGETQHVANVMIALAGMAAGDAPLVGKAFAQQCSMQLLAQASTRLTEAMPQHITNTMWATAELGLPATAFVTKAVVTTPSWVPNSVSRDLTQAASACALLQHKDEAFMKLLLQRASQLLQQQPGSTKATRGKGRAMSARDKVSLASLLAASVVQLDMQQLAGPTCKLVASSGAGQDIHMHPASCRYFWMFHSWLLQHQLMKGKGLTGLLTDQQLQQGEQEAAKYGTGLHATM